MIGKAAGDGFPLAIIFKQLDNIPRHPGQLYEAFGYVFVFLILFFLYSSYPQNSSQLFLFWDSIDVLGRIYVAKEGINAQDCEKNRHPFQK